MSKVGTLNAAGDAVTLADATVGDLFTTALDQNKSLFGSYKYVQELIIGLGGAVWSNYRHAGRAFDFGG